MHAVSTMKHWSHHRHDGMLNMWHHIDQHLHSRHFWTGVAMTLLIMGLVALFIILARNAPINSPGRYPYELPHTYYLF